MSLYARMLARELERTKAGGVVRGAGGHVDPQTVSNSEVDGSEESTSETEEDEEMSDQYHDISEVGSVEFNGCAPIGSNSPQRVSIEVSEAWDDVTPCQHVLLTCKTGLNGVIYHMDLDKAQALGLLLVSAATGMKEMMAKMDAEDL